MTGLPFSAIRRPVENELSKTRSARRAWWRLPILLGLVLAAIIWSRVQSPHETPKNNSAEMPEPIAIGDPRPKVELSINFGGGRRTNFAAIAWHDGMTVADLMNAWPNVRITQKGTGESAFVTAIDDVANQGADGQNWTYSVNNQIADRSFAVYKLKAGDQVLWTFGPRQ
jgi:hypothetical protein